MRDGSSVLRPSGCGDAGGLPDIVEHEKTGLLVDKGDIDGLSAALGTLLGDTRQCIRIGQAAQVFAREHLDARKTIDRLVTLYNELIYSKAAL